MRKEASFVVVVSFDVTTTKYPWNIHDWHNSNDGNTAKYTWDIHYC